MIAWRTCDWVDCAWRPNETCDVREVQDVAQPVLRCKRLLRKGQKCHSVATTHQVQTTPILRQSQAPRVQDGVRDDEPARRQGVLQPLPSLVATDLRHVLEHDARRARGVDGVEHGFEKVDVLVRVDVVGRAVRTAKGLARKPGSEQVARGPLGGARVPQRGCVGEIGSIAIDGRRRDLAEPNATRARGRSANGKVEAADAGAHVHKGDDVVRGEDALDGTLGTGNRHRVGDQAMVPRRWEHKVFRKPLHASRLTRRGAALQVPKLDRVRAGEAPGYGVDRVEDEVLSCLETRVVACDPETSRGRIKDADVAVPLRDALSFVLRRVLHVSCDDLHFARREHRTSDHVPLQVF